MDINNNQSKEAESIEIFILAIADWYLEYSDEAIETASFSLMPYFSGCSSGLSYQVLYL